jgi:sortase (surface protein transpeptidase)
VKRSVADGYNHLGHFLKPSEDIYALAFVGTIKQGLVMYYYNKSREDESEKNKEEVPAAVDEKNNQPESELAQAKQEPSQDNQDS